MAKRSKAGEHDPSEVGQYFSPKELAARWGCTPRWIYDLIRRGELYARKMGRLQRIPDTVVFQFEARQQPSTMPMEGS